jgi:hypothetical protein
MNSDLRKLYVAIIDNKVVCFNTNLSAFIRDFNNQHRGLKSLSFYTKEFKSKDVIVFFDEDEGKVYHLQKIL